MGNYIQKCFPQEVEEFTRNLKWIKIKEKSNYPNSLSELLMLNHLASNIKLEIKVEGSWRNIYSITTVSVTNPKVF